MTISTTDLIEAQKAMVLAFSILDEVRLTQSQFERKLDAIKGKVALQCIMYQLNAKVEVSE